MAKGQFSLENQFLLAVGLLAGIIALSYVVDITSPSGGKATEIVSTETPEPEPILTITVATIKDEYEVGETVYLTESQKTDAGLASSSIPVQKQKPAESDQVTLQDLQ
ncbi:MAG: hypothetical protein HYW50_03060 [Candidatus Diapherotrites archaeon]|nr:hypothetical protein [Candidatus Diapherotrites archaeon]